MTDTAPARYGVIGHPIAHSRSPWIHARFAEQTKQALTYEAIDCPPGDFAKTLKRLQKEGFSGVNVTVPFKTEAFAAAKTHSERAQRAQAANTLMWQRDAQGKTTLYADNTDGAGLIRDIMFNADYPLGRLHILLLGAGGAGAGALGGLIAVCPASVTVVNRTQDKAQALIERHYAWANMHGVALVARGLDDMLAPPDISEKEVDPAFGLVVNATSASLGGQALALPWGKIAPDAMVYDMMYGAAAQAFLQPAQAVGLRTRDGLGMLVEQASVAFKLWRGVAPRTAPVLTELLRLVHAEQVAEQAAQG